MCSAYITKGTEHESPYLKPLLDDTVKIFTIKQVSADAGYLSMDNVQCIEDAGAKPFIMLKKNTNIKNIKMATSAWSKMIKFCRDRRTIFLDHYHQRSNVESTFAMLKRKFGFYVRGRLKTTQDKEILFKLVIL